MNLLSRSEMGQVQHSTSTSTSTSTASPSTSTSTDAILYKFNYRYANLNSKKILKRLLKTKETNCAIKMHRDLYTLYLNHVTQNVSKLSLVTTNTCTVVSQVLMELGIPSFCRPTLIRNYYSSFQNRLKTSDILVKHIVAFTLWY